MDSLETADVDEVCQMTLESAVERCTVEHCCIVVIFFHHAKLHYLCTVCILGYTSYVVHICKYVVHICK